MTVERSVMDNCSHCAVPAAVDEVFVVVVVVSDVSVAVLDADVDWVSVPGSAAVAADCASPLGSACTGLEETTFLPSSSSAQPIVKTRRIRMDIMNNDVSFLIFAPLEVYCSGNM